MAANVKLLRGSRAHGTPGPRMAYTLRMRGAPWSTVAKKFNYASAASAQLSVRTWAKRVGAVWPIEVNPKRPQGEGL